MSYWLILLSSSELKMLDFRNMGFRQSKSLNKKKNTADPGGKWLQKYSSYFWESVNISLVYLGREYNRRNNAVNSWRSYFTDPPNVLLAQSCLTGSMPVSLVGLWGIPHQGSISCYIFFGLEKNLVLVCKCSMSCRRMMISFSVDCAVNLKLHNS